MTKQVNMLEQMIIEDIVKTLKGISDINPILFWNILQNIIKDIVIEEKYEISLIWQERLKGILNGERTKQN